MSKQVVDVQIHASDSEESLINEDDLDISVDLIDNNLYLGNLACARSEQTLQRLGITHILTVDVVPLPRAILDRTKLNTEYVKLADVPKEDLISHLPFTNEFIQKSISEGGTILVHCHFGVSRSAAVVIAYIMTKYKLCYEDAFTLVKSKRRFVGPNIGFAAQLKLFGHMGFRLVKEDPRYKQFRLKLAGQKLKQVKILPQLFADLVKPDPGLTRERPDPVVYRCKSCRRVVASQSNIIPHLPKQLKIELAKKGSNPPPSKLTGLNCSENGQILIEKLKSLACQINNIMKSEEEIQVDLPDIDKSMHGIDNMQGIDNAVSRHSTLAQTCRELTDSAEASQSSNREDDGPIEHLDGNSELNMVDPSIVAAGPEGSQGSAGAGEVCRMMWFVEPMSWMRGVRQEPSGKLHCPKCHNKIGSFSWIMGCKCPCGQKVAPAFYLVPSKVEWANIVQNVQVTV